MAICGGFRTLAVEFLGTYRDSQELTGTLTKFSWDAARVVRVSNRLLVVVKILRDH